MIKTLIHVIDFEGNRQSGIVEYGVASTTWSAFGFDILRGCVVPWVRLVISSVISIELTKIHYRIVSHLMLNGSCFQSFVKRRILCA